MMTQANRYTKLAALTGRADNLDSSYHAAFYLLSYDPEVCKIAARYIDHDGIRFTGLKRAARGFDERTCQVIDVAHNLFSWTSKCSVTPFDISRLGYPYMEQVCNAFYIAVGEVEVVIQKDRDGQAKMKLDTSQYQQSKRVYQQFEQFQSAMIEDMKQESADETMDSEVME
ncbi:hypothetical protein [Caproicibacter fermentans]|uniref:Uncharacterized protein n=1 Tax=Caproicibacter fermentans TaxID=2576756 RepID=A0A7G8TF22_9FIRM|nr:hypothetical protein [Caproicibacter fermentans]QNK42213.1 hypothetical protein HCR03_08395 [Caproicibacter fermentans]